MLNQYLNKDEQSIESRRSAEKQEEAKYEKLICHSGWKALCARVEQCIAYYERIAFNGGAKRAERINALERVAAMREVIAFPKSFLERQSDDSSDIYNNGGEDAGK
ncbi:MAG: hypothetical protein LBP51_07335 [Deferribacteraceae bacterium]|jgi:hypothetical protein|nr:hypothetical protein [Deferribacteraceae bacterium]